MNLLWKRQDDTGLERFELAASEESWMLRGTILVLHRSQPAEVRYRVQCDSAWRTESAEVSLYMSDGEKHVSVTVEDGRWFENTRINRETQGCIDIDLGWTPSTNTLPIRRLNLAVGESSGTIEAAWVKFPDLKLERLSQEYTRLSEREYLYTSAGGSFTAKLLVDGEGLVVDYENFWHRVGAPHDH